MARKKKIKKDRNEGLTPLQIMKRGLVIESAIVWTVAFYLLFLATLLVIQLGPYELDLAVRDPSDVESVFKALLSGQFLGGFAVLWLFVAIPFAVFYYRYFCRRRAARMHPVSKEPAKAPSVTPVPVA